MKASDFDYYLPAELIAQEPLAERSASRMMVLNREAGSIDCRNTEDLAGYLRQGDLLVINNTRVIPSRIFGYREDTGGKVELLLVERVSPGEIAGHNSDAGQGEEWIALCKAGSKVRVGVRLSLAGGRMKGQIAGVEDMGRIVLKLWSKVPVLEVLDKDGFVPVPPYIRRDYPDPALADKGTNAAAVAHSDKFLLDRERYQTVYAREPGAVAAPTAGLHFTEDMLSDMKKMGIGCAQITLHVGPGTFRPVKADNVEDHIMESERYEVSDQAARLINNSKKQGGRIIAIGSTTVRTLETVASEDGTVKSGSGRSSLFIRPPYNFKTVDVMLTNFHLPRSTLIMMVCAFAGIDMTLAAYEKAVKSGYRFYSYGDCMLIL